MDRLAELKAIRESIKHWCVDIRRPLQKGRRIVNVAHQGKRWMHTDKAVPMRSSACPLCKLYLSGKKGKCYHCPLTRDENCCLTTISSYWVFFESSNLESADMMIAALRRAYLITKKEVKTNGQRKDE